MNRTSIKIVSESGAGLLSMGKIITDGLKNLGYFLNADREYPSVIKGGEACFTINFSDEEICALAEKTDILVSISKKPAKKYFDKLKNGGIWIHGYEKVFAMKDLYKEAEEKNIKIVHLNIREIVREVGGITIMRNNVLLGMLWKTLGLDFNNLENEVKKIFAKKPKILPMNLRCLESGFKNVENLAKQLNIPKSKNAQNILIDGNHSISLGAIASGVRFYCAYPMSPASSILSHLAEYSRKTGMVVKQAEDEITVINMTLGASFAGTRSMCATSGGGFDLMTETISLAGILENPLVCVIVQRPGPATGLPTWTAQGDLNLAIFSGHGEYGKIVMSVGDPTDAFTLTQDAQNLAEKFQVPVILLSEKVIAESLITVPDFAKNIGKIERGLSDVLTEKLEPDDRYKITKNGLSKRWIPCSDEDAYYFANGDEHNEMGCVHEDLPMAKEMYAKRVRKMDLITKNLPEAKILGDLEKAKIVFVGWGSSRNIMKDIIKIFSQKNLKIAYLHYEYLWPLKTEILEKIQEKNQNIHLIENNMTGQLGGLLEQTFGKNLFKGKLLKWDGRPFFMEEVCEYVEKNI